MKVCKTIALLLLLVSGISSANVIETGYVFGEKVKSGDKKIEGSKASYVLDISNMQNKYISYAIGSYEKTHGLCQMSIALKFKEDELSAYIAKIQERYGKPITYLKGKTSDEYSSVLWESESKDFASLEIKFKKSDMSKASLLAQSKDIFKCQTTWYKK